MIISWFTQPPGQNASYYQYDTVTQQFSRTRLELGRQSSSNTNDTFVSYRSQRTVGFSDVRYSTTNPGDHWTVNDGTLYFDGTPLATTPSANAKVYDCTDPTDFVHRGNPVTETPTLPLGIEPKHLALLANEAMVSKTKITLTAGTATQEQLIATIQGEVCKVLKVDSFAAATDAVILEKLKSQAGQISDSASRQQAKSLDQALETTKAVNQRINEQITDGVLTPTQEFETAFAELQTAVDRAQDAGGDVRQALTEIGSAQQSLNKAIASIDAAKYEATAKQLENAGAALEDAAQNATKWQEIEVEYEPLTEAESIEDYQREIGIETEVAA